MCKHRKWFFFGVCKYYRCDCIGRHCKIKQQAIKQQNNLVHWGQEGGKDERTIFNQSKKH